MRPTVKAYLLALLALLFALVMVAYDLWTDRKPSMDIVEPVYRRP